MKPKTDKTIQKVDTAIQTLTALLIHKNKSRAAESLGITRDTLYKRIDQYKLADYLNQIQEDALEILKHGTLDAAQNLVDKVKHMNPVVSMEASREVLDRAGVTKPKEQPQTNVQVNNFGQITNDLKKRLNWDEEPEVS